MSATPQHTSTSDIEAAISDADMLPSPTMPTMNDNDQTLASQCKAFQSRIESYTHELNRLEAINQDIHQDRLGRQQDHHRDRLIDSASPEPRAVTPEEETHKKLAARLRERTRQLAHELEVVKEGMNEMRIEMESVWKKMNACDE